MRAHASDAVIQVGSNCRRQFGVQELGCQALKEFAAFNSESASNTALHGLTSEITGYMTLCAEVRRISICEGVSRWC